MRRVVCTSLLVVVCGRAIGEEKQETISPSEAAKKVGEKVTLQMEVKSVGHSDSGVYFLNSKENYRDEGNFTIFINKDGVESLQKAKIDDPAITFKDKTVRVTGEVKLYKDHPEIAVEKAEQIQIVEKK